MQVARRATAARANTSTGEGSLISYDDDDDDDNDDDDDDCRPAVVPAAAPQHAEQAVADHRHPAEEPQQGRSAQSDNDISRLKQAFRFSLILKGMIKCPPPRDEWEGNLEITSHPVNQKK